MRSFQHSCPHGTLTDASTSATLGGGTITFTASLAITGPKITNTIGKYSATGLIAPATPGAYHITAHFAATSLYDVVNYQSIIYLLQTQVLLKLAILTNRITNTATGSPQINGIWYNVKVSRM